SGWEAAGMGFRKVTGQKSEYAELNETIKYLTNELATDEMKQSKKNVIEGKIPGADQTDASKKLADAISFNTEEQINTQLEKLRSDKSKLEIGSSDYKSVSAEITRLENRLNPKKGKGSG